MRQVGGHPDRAVRRHEPAPFRRRHLHGACGGVDQLCLAVGVGIQPGAFGIPRRQQMHAVARRATAVGQRLNWRLRDSHWRDSVSCIAYNGISRRSGHRNMNSPARVITLVNVAHFIDHYAMLIFAAAVLVMGPSMNMTYTELLPYATPGFIAFGAGSLFTGWLGDRWSRRHMMVIYFYGIGLSMISVGFVRTPLQLGAALFAVGLFASIYHPVGTAMIVSYADQLGRAMGLNGVWGNLGVASSALVTGGIGQYLGWRFAFIVPGIVTILVGAAFALTVVHEDRKGTRQAAAQSRVSRDDMWRGIPALLIGAVSY